jgi:hypothetical protein
LKECKEEIEEMKEQENSSEQKNHEGKLFRGQ